jgi:uncharacterized hydrophobic protein (TIGR00271 family)
MAEQHGRQTGSGRPPERKSWKLSARDLRAWTIRALRRMRAVQDRLLNLLGANVDRRTTLVAAMLERSAHEATSYWLQLIVSIGIATLGLVVGSAAVIIGAMLVAPLMVPIIGLAMGLASGSPFLVLRSAGRIVLSVLVATSGAALITVLLPFHELNAEIAARTSPTVLDLLTAGFCALAGVYAAVRPGSDTATTAAGTSIGISLVPPLCASGYGLGTTAWPVAGGAALLFLTNLVAIVVVGTLSFVAAGFNRVDTTTLERRELAKQQNGVVTAAISRQLAGLFESTAGPALRFLMPLVLLAAVYVPLRRALDEVAWQVRVRAAVQDALDRQSHRIVQSRARVERHEVDVLVVLLGKTADAEAVRFELHAEIEAIAGVAPRVEVLAIPDAKAFAGLESTLRTAADPLPLPVVPSLSPLEQLDSGRELIQSSVVRLWPAATAGEPLVIELGAAARGPLRIDVVHLGPDLGADAVETLARSLSAAVEREVQVVAVAIPAQALTRADGDLNFASRVMSALRESAAIESIHVCVVEPALPAKRRRVAARDQELADLLRDPLTRHPRVVTQAGDEWSVRFVRGACPSEKPSDARALSVSATE